jgi:uncharacterized protein
VSHRPAQTGSSAHTISALGAFSIGIGGIIGGGIFATLGIAVAGSRGSTWISYLVGGIVALLTCYSYAKLSVAFPSKGGTITFINRAFGPGVFSGGLNIMLVLSYAVLLAVYAHAFATYAATFLPSQEQANGEGLFASGIIVALSFVNFLGPGLVDKSEGALNVGKLSILTLFVVVGLAVGGIAWDRLGPTHWVAPANIVASGMIVFLSYEGFELIANASGRVRTPGRSLPIAFFGSVLVAIAFYVLIIVVTVGHLPFEALEKAQNYALSAAAATFMGRPGFVILAIGAMLAAASAVNAGVFGASKLPIVLAAQGEAPRRFESTLWGRHPLGLFAIVTIALLTANFLNLHALSGAASAAFLLIFAAVNVANMRLARETASATWLSGLAALVCLAALATMMVQTLADPDHSQEVFFIVVLATLPFIYESLYRLYKRVSGSRAK